MVINKNISNLLNNYDNNCLAHAFLIETNNKEQTLNDILQFMKYINCPSKYEENCSNCNLCHLIENKILPNLIIINPDGQAIKKEQIEDLKKEMLTKPFISKFNMYIINECEKLNAFSANAMLKFIEEPETNILGFFITNNRENVINTIKSRCEIIRAYYDEENEKTIDYWKTKYSDIYSTAVDYLYNLEFDNNKSILYNKVITDKKWERNDFTIFFKIILMIYEGFISKNNIDDKLSFFNDFTKKDLYKRINLVIDIMDKLNYNVNLNLLLDYFVIGLGED